MPIDKQLDRSALPLTFVLDQVYPINLDRPSEPVADNENKIVIEEPKTTTPTNQFEGFGSFC